MAEFIYSPFALILLLDVVAAALCFILASRVVEPVPRKLLPIAVVPLTRAGWIIINASNELTCNGDGAIGCAVIALFGYTAVAAFGGAIVVYLLFKFLPSEARRLRGLSGALLLAAAIEVYRAFNPNPHL